MKRVTVKQQLSFGVYILVYIFTFTCNLGYTDTLTKNRASVSNGQELFPIYLACVL